MVKRISGDTPLPIRSRFDGSLGVNGECVNEVYVNGEWVYNPAYGPERPYNSYTINDIAQNTINTVNGYVTQDSGERTTFKTGSMRDTETGKARVDLIYPRFITACSVHALGGVMGKLLDDIQNNLLDKDLFNHRVDLALTANDVIAVEFNPNLVGSVNSDYDVIPPQAWLRLGALLGRGAEKYGERNWEKGQPLSRVRSSLLRHYIQWLDQQVLGYSPSDGEDHFAAVLFNLMVMYHHTVEFTPDSHPSVFDLEVNG